MSFVDEYKDVESTCEICKCVILDIRERRFCGAECYMKSDEAFNYSGLEDKPRYEFVDRYPPPQGDYGQPPTKWLYDTKEQEFIRKAILS